MYEVIDKEEFTPIEWRRDTEVTLGPAMLLGIFFGLVLLCGLCFGLGYSLGSHGGQGASTAGQASGARRGVMAASSQAKPSAAPQKTPDVQSIVDDLPVVAASGVGAAAQTPGLTTASGADTTQPLIQSAQPAAALEEAPAGMLMIQIAAISHQEDADVLVDALRKRSYSASVSRDAADGQFHVRVGPFTSRTLANEMRQKLNGDGYNAVVQP